MYRVGIDLGGTTIAAGIVEEKGTIVSRLTIATGENLTGEELIMRIAGLYRSLIRESGIPENEIVMAGIGVPGTVNQKTGEIEDANNLGLDHYPFRNKLEEQIGRFVALENDANVAALGEYYLQGLDVSSFFMVTLGTGVGGAYLVDKHILTGVNGALGEIGHMVIERNGRPCTCGRRGCLEQYASARAFVKDTQRLMQEKQSGLLWEQYKNNLEALDGKKIFDAFRKHDRIAEESVARYVEYLGEGIVNVINILQPDVLCIGGGISQAGDCYFDRLKEYVRTYRYSQNAAKNTRIYMAKNGNDAAIIGAAMQEIRKA